MMDQYGFDQGSANNGLPARGAARRSRRRAHFHGIGPEALRHPALADHLGANGKVGGVTMVGHAAPAAVIKTSYRDEARGAAPVRAGQRNGKSRGTFERPVGIPAQRGAFGGERGEEVRVLWRVP